ncbi:MAG: hypothetical protein RSF13_09415, partial [Clostridiales bacterium]
SSGWEGILPNIRLYQQPINYMQYSIICNIPSHIQLDAKISIYIIAQYLSTHKILPKIHKKTK